MNTPYKGETFKVSRERKFKIRNKVLQNSSYSFRRNVYKQIEEEINFFYTWWRREFGEKQSRRRKERERDKYLNDVWMAKGYGCRAGFIYTVYECVQCVFGQWMFSKYV